MWKPKKILIPTDFSDYSNSAIASAALFAKKFDSEITLLHIISLLEADPNSPDYRFPNMDEIYALLENAATENMEKIHQIFKNLKFNKVMIRGISPAEEILSYAGENDFDLIVMGTHGRSGLSHFLLGSATERVVRYALCPVVTVHSQNSGFEIDGGIRRIVVPVDFSSYSKKTAEYATVLAEAFDASLQFIHVIEETVHPAYFVTGKVTIFNLVPDIVEKSISAMQDFVAKLVPEDITHSFHVVEGRAHTEIVKFANEQKADLIAMATHGLSGLEHMLVGSTTERVVRKASVPVLSIRTQREK